MEICTNSIGLTHIDKVQVIFNPKEKQKDNKIKSNSSNPQAIINCTFPYNAISLSIYIYI